MKPIIAIAAVVVACSACSGGPDTPAEAVSNDLSTQLADAGVVVDDECLSSTLAKYTPEQVAAIQASLAGGDQSGQAGELIAELITCTPTVT